jgi:hypothetical protein
MGRKDGGDKNKKRKNKIKQPDCKHDYAHCRWDKKDKCNVYQCCKCGQYLYQ